VHQGSWPASLRIPMTVRLVHLIADETLPERPIVLGYLGVG
ncbi:unnamed protein product, partial [Acidithrix sp. C25]